MPSAMLPPVVALLAACEGPATAVSFEAPPSSNSVAVSPQSLVLTAGGDTSRLSVNLTNASRGKTVLWRSSAPGIISVDASGKVTSGSEGVATVTARVGTDVDSALVTSARFLASLTLASAEIQLNVGDTATLIASGADPLGHPIPGINPLWSTSNAGVATVTPSGQISALSAGQAWIKAQAQGHSDSTQVSVSDQVLPPSINVSTEAPVVEAGMTIGFSLRFSGITGPADTAGVVLSTSPQGVLNIQGDRLVGVTAGTAWVIARAGSQLRDSVQLVVLPTTVVLIQLSPSTLHLEPGQSAPISSIVYDRLGRVLTDRTITWSIEDGAVASLSGATVTALAQGGTLVRGKIGEQHSDVWIQVQNTGSTGGGGGGGGPPPLPAGRYGTGYSASGLANTAIRTLEFSQTFRPATTSNLLGFRAYLVDKEGGYGAGTGGTLRFEVQGSGPDGFPNGVRIGTGIAQVVHQRLNGDGNASIFRRHDFSVPIPVVAGQTYHLVVRNTDPDPNNNFVSMNALYQGSGPGTDMTVNMRPPGEAWIRRLGDGMPYVPIASYYYADGSSDGNGYIHALSHAEHTAVVSQSEKVRQTFVVSGANRGYSSVHLYVVRRSGSGPMRVQLLKSGVVEFSATHSSESALDALGGQWLTFQVSGQLDSGSAYSLEFSTIDAATSFEAQVLRTGSAYDFSAGSEFSDGHAEEDNGTGWQLWRIWGTLLNQADLMFYFNQP